MTEAVYVVDAVRTPVGRIGGGLAGVRPDDLGAAAVRGLLDRVPGLDPARIDDVHLGNGNGAGEDNRNVARMVALLAGLPTSVPGVTENRLCGSGLEAVAAASREIATGDAGVCIAGGVESMSRAPWVVAKPEAGYERTDRTMHSTTLGWRLVNPRMPEQWTRPLGEGRRSWPSGTASAERPRTRSPCAATIGPRPPGGRAGSPARSSGPRRRARTATSRCGTAPASMPWRGCGPCSGRKGR